MFAPLTKKEKEILDFIKVFAQLHGYAPSLMEIKEHFQLGAVSTVHEHIQNLKRKGYVTKEISQARSIRVINTELSEQEFLEIPVTYLLNGNSLLVETPSHKTVFVHRSQLDRSGTYLAIEITSNLYENAGIFNRDIVVIKEGTQLPFNSYALASTGEKFHYLGRIIEQKQLPAFEKMDGSRTVAKNFQISGKIVLLYRNYNDSLFPVVNPEVA
jgi:repressor LexA